MNNVVIETVSYPLAKAYTKNVQQDVFNPVRLTTTVPYGPGVFAMGEGGMVAPNRLLLFPFCEGRPGSSFLMCLYGWRSIGPEGNKPKVWIFSVLAQFLCITGNIPGPVLQGSPTPSGYNLPITPLDNMCDAMALTRGVLGLSGFINSMPPGSGVPAFAAVELFGSQLISFDFAQLPNNNVAANCLWARG